MMGNLEGVVMEMQDCAYPLLEEVVATADPNVAFADIDVALCVGAMPRKEGMERKDLLKANAKIFEAQGKALNQFAKKTVKVVVVGNPANTNAFIISSYAPDIPKTNFSCLTRLDENRAKAQIALKCGVFANEVKNVTIWGNHSSTQFPDIEHGTVKVSGQDVPIRTAINDDDYLNNEFIKCVQTRGAAVIKARKLSSATSAAKAICDHMRDWWFGTNEGEWASMGVCSDGSYGIPAGLFYSYPLKISNRSFQIVQGLDISNFAREKMDATAKELIEERDMASEFLAQ